MKFLRGTVATLKPSQTVILVLEEQEADEECHLCKKGGEVNSVKNNLIIKLTATLILIYLLN
jgi:hypothetical protein